MIRILITGKGSYIGTAVKSYLSKFAGEYVIDELDLKKDTWKMFDFNKYDIVYHVAGIAHIKENSKNENLYFKVNKDLAVEVAEKAKASKVHQFIFMSSMSVYGLDCSSDYITEETECKADSAYGRSKLEAEIAICELETENFKVCILRPPMVYGKDSPGNLTKLFKAVRKIHLFPKIKNQRSSITVDKLCEYIKTYIDEDSRGIYLPQNDIYMCTYEMVKEQMEKENVRVLYTSIFNPVIKFMIGKVGLMSKCFGDLKYEK